MPSFIFSVIDEGNVGADPIAAFCAAQAEKLRTYLVPYYPDFAGTQLVPVPAGATPPAGTVQLVLAPNATIANTLGYHEMGPDGFPIAIVELDACREAGMPWTVPASHEVDETCGNPFLTRFATVGTRTYPFELCDPVTTDEVLINGIGLANAVTPAFYDPASPATARFDLMSKLRSGIAAGVPHGGWLEWSENGAWSNAWGADLSPAHIAFMRAREGRRWRLRGRVTL